MFGSEISPLSLSLSLFLYSRLECDLESTKEISKARMCYKSLRMEWRRGRGFCFAQGRK